MGVATPYSNYFKIFQKYKNVQHGITISRQDPADIRPVNLDISEQHRVVDFLVQLATLETGSWLLSGWSWARLC